MVFYTVLVDKLAVIAFFNSLCITLSPFSTVQGWVFQELYTVYHKVMHNLTFFVDNFIYPQFPVH